MVAGLAGALALTACSSGDGSSGGSSDPQAREIGYFGVDDGGDPTDGGVLTFGSFVFPTSLDPTETRAAGSVGGTELAAIYDVLMTSDRESGDFTPRLAESVKANDDYTEYTLRLPADTTFSDGSPLDSAAVKWSFDRYRDSGFDLAGTLDSVLEGIDTPDDRTVVFTLNRSWSRFPVMLSMGPGFVVAPSSEDGGGFTPIGAGPFTVSEFVQNEKLVLAARDDYHGGAPHLAGLEFIPTSGAQSQLEFLDDGQIDMAYMLQDEPVIEAVIDAGYPGYLDQQALGNVLLINQAEGRPGADLRVRQAIAYGLDRDAVNQRSMEGLGVTDPSLLPESSLWSSTVTGTDYDPDKARELLEEAKADGFDGRLEFVTPSEPFAMDSALAIQASLNSVGFDIELDPVASAADGSNRVFNERDFDLNRAAFAFLDDAPILRAQGSMGSTSSNNPHGYADDEMDGLLEELWTATDDSATEAALSKIQERMNETVPYVIIGPMSVLSFWHQDVHGLQRTIDNIWLFDKAWIS